MVWYGVCVWTAWRILIALEEKHLPYRGVCVSFSSGVLKSPFFRALNPRMRIPVLVEPVDGLAPPADGSTAPPAQEDGAVATATSGIARLSPFRSIISESSAILEFLERKYPSPVCMPRALPLFGVAQSRLHESNEILSVVGDLVVYLRRFPPEKRSPQLVDAKWATVERELRLWEAYLDGHHFLVDADTPYLCDFVLFTNIAYAVRCGLQLDGLYPRLATFYMRLCERPSIDKTWPPHWRTSFGSKVLTKCFQCAGKPTGRCECQRQPGSAPPPSPLQGQQYQGAPDPAGQTQ